MSLHIELLGRKKLVIAATIDRSGEILAVICQLWRSVIIKADVYDRVCALADDARAAYPLAMKVFGQDGWGRYANGRV
jgi:hypothetical protein